MIIQNDYGFGELKDSCWSGAIHTLELVEAYNAEDALMTLLEDVFFDTIPTMTQVNDFIWFEAGDMLEEQGYFKDE